MDTSDEIAIVGIGCNFPGGEGIDRFWQVLVEGRNCTVEIPHERFNVEEWYDPEENKPGKSLTRWAALVEGFNEFDNKVFGINNLEAERLDPQQKVLLECAYRALESAGIPSEEVAGSRIGVFIGLMNRDFECMTSKMPKAVNQYNVTGSAMSLAANRISYVFNLTGPSLALDTACSSSLVALHYAFLSIKQGDCEAALCGGVSYILDPHVNVMLSKAKMISPDGMSKPFSMRADGYGRGEGCGIVLLKPLKKALEDYNKIWGVISMSAVNQDGQSVTPITKPSQKQQEKLLESIYSTHINPSVVQYVEVHGTGTPAGDHAEAKSIGNIVGRRRSRNAPPLKIGSVKGNIGHTESAAGIAGLIKVLLMMHHEKIVPSLHYSESVSSINTEKLNLFIPTEVEKWEESREFGRVAGISSFGFGGTNVHIVVRQFKQQPQAIPLKRPYELFLLSAASNNSLKLAIEDTAQQLSQRKKESLQDLAYTSVCRRSHANYMYRKAFVTTSLGNLKQKLNSAANEKISCTKGPPELVFVFCGNGAHYKGMGKILLSSEPVFKEKCQEIANLFLKYEPIRFLELIEKEFDDFSRPKVTQPLLFIIQVALASLLKFWGIKPATVIGSSIGEVAAAHCAGFLSLVDAVKVIHYRSMFQSKVVGGKMLVVGNIPIEEISKALIPHSRKVCIASFNSPNCCTLSGDADSVNAIHEELAEQFEKRNIFLYILPVPAAYHSYMMDPIVKDIKENIGDLAKQKPEAEMISTVTGRVSSKRDFTTGIYWARNVREPVAFTEAITTSSQGRKNLVFIEIAPKPYFRRMIREILGEQTFVFPSLQKEKNYETLFALVENLFELGYNLNWPHFYDGLKAIPTDYPKYHFDHQNLKDYFQNLQKQHSMTSINHPLISNGDNGLEFICTISQDTTPYVYEHKNNGVPLVPSALFVELGLASVMNSLRPKMPLKDYQMSITFVAPCMANKNFLDLKIQVELGKIATVFKILSFSSAIYATGKIAKMTEALNERKLLSLESIIQRSNLVITVNKVYETLSLIGFQYGSVLKQLSDILYCDKLKEGITTITVNEKTGREILDYYIHPVLLDYFLQMTAVMATKCIESEGKPGFPTALGSLAVFRPLEEEMQIYIKITKSTENYVEVCGCFTDKHGQVLAELKNVGFKFVTSINDNVFLENKWKEISSIPEAINLDESPQFIVFADQFGVAQLLKQYLHNNSKYVTLEEWETIQNSERAGDMIKKEIRGFHDVLFMWGIQELSEETSALLIMQHLAKCCEAFRQVILALREENDHCSVTVITYRTTSTNVNHINPGYALPGMVRSCFAEVPEITFRMIDISFMNKEEIASLAQAIINYKGEDFPELWINQGRIYTAEVKWTSFQNFYDAPSPKHLENSEMFTLYTANPYKTTDLSAQLLDHKVTYLENHAVEVQVEKICMHSEDYFPVSTSSLTFGQTLYWTEHTMEKHQLLALDFSGTVTNTGKGVKEVKVGDHIATCFPIDASSKILIPDTVCLDTTKLTVLRSAPCVSYFIIAWKILIQILFPRAQPLASLAIISMESESILSKVLTLVFKRNDWRVSQVLLSSDLWNNVQHCQVLIFLPPLTSFCVEMLSDLSHLRDVVFVYGGHQPEFLQQLFHNGRDYIEVHTVSLSQVFQKSALLNSYMAVFKWLCSMNLKESTNFSYSVFQQNRSWACTEPTPDSYFTCKAIPLLVLRGRLPESEVSAIPKHIAGNKLFRSNALYIVSGGLSGLGFETVRFIAQHGGGHVVILSRRTPNTEQRKEIQSLESQNENCKIISLQCDVSAISEVEKVFSYISNIFPKGTVKGVFHSAVVLDDAQLEALNISRFEKVLSPKVAGAINLHCITKGQELDYFVCYSSITSFLGNATQTNYAAANSFLDIFCHYRRNCGLAGQSINWGALNVGLLLNKQKIHKFLASRGILTLQKSEIDKFLSKCLLLNNPQQAIVRFDFKTLQDCYFSQVPPLKIRFSTILQEETKQLYESNIVALENSSQSENEEYITSLAKEISNTSLKDISMDTTLVSLGIDSMAAMTLKNKLFHDKRVNVPLIKLLDPNATLLTIKLLLRKLSK
ncbi:mycocerosic acid synthase-like [Monodelphis domestica]|uniref:mycocerosic acid synthase-like n=1 Tax=Monodelphis domestica TaxID=13616 RepID=UPI0024E1C395|nr:mycocerosic acid synthase-like [Monodelphis domestica]XP_056656052.1 mycocerosic acid synthase-like [Monodelphis domestica]